MSLLANPVRRPKVLHCINRLGLGGSENVAFEILRQLRHGIESALFTAKPPAADAVGHALQQEVHSLAMPWYRGTRLGMKHGGMLFGGLALARAIREWQPDVVHYHAEASESCGAAMMLLAGSAGATPALRTIHNTQYWKFSPRVGIWCDQRLRNTSAVAVSTSAQAAFQALRRSSQAGSDDCTVIYNGVSVPIRAPRSGTLAAGRIRVIFAGRFAHEKGLDLLCRAIPFIPLPDGVQVDITFVGTGPEAHLPLALEQRTPAGWRVTVLPPTPCLIPLLDEHDVAVIPSRFEGLGLVAIEAIRRGLAVVATSASGLREVFPPDYPYLAEPENLYSLAAVLGQAFAQPSRWAAATAAAQEFGRPRFDPDVMATAYLRIYHTLAGRGK